MFDKIWKMSCFRASHLRFLQRSIPFSWCFFWGIQPTLAVGSSSRSVQTWFKAVHARRYPDENRQTSATCWSWSHVPFPACRLNCHGHHLCPPSRMWKNLQTFKFAKFATHYTHGRTNPWKLSWSLFHSFARLSQIDFPCMFSANIVQNSSDYAITQDLDQGTESRGEHPWM